MIAVGRDKTGKVAHAFDFPHRDDVTVRLMHGDDLVILLVKEVAVSLVYPAESLTKQKSLERREGGAIDHV